MSVSILSTVQRVFQVQVECVLLYCFADLLSGLVSLSQRDGQVLGAIGVQQGDFVYRLLGYFALRAANIHDGTLGPGLKQLLKPFQVQLLHTSDIL